jgi:hypothetical protein
MMTWSIPSERNFATALWTAALVSVSAPICCGTLM